MTNIKKETKSTKSKVNKDTISEDQKASKEIMDKFLDDVKNGKLPIQQFQRSPTFKSTLWFGLAKFYILLFFFFVDLLTISVGLIKGSPINYPFAFLNWLVLTLFLIFF